MRISMKLELHIIIILSMIISDIRFFCLFTIGSCASDTRSETLLSKHFNDLNLNISLSHSHLSNITLFLNTLPFFKNHLLKTSRLYNSYFNQPQTLSTLCKLVAHLPLYFSTYFATFKSIRVASSLA